MPKNENVPREKAQPVADTQAEAPKGETMPFIAGSWSGRPQHEIDWQKEHGLHHDEYEVKAVDAPETPKAEPEPPVPVTIARTGRRELGAKPDTETKAEVSP